MNVLPTELPDVLLIEPQVFEDRRCLFRFPGSHRSSAMRCRLSVGHVQKQNIVALLNEANDGATHAQLLIVRMRTDDKDVCHKLMLRHVPRFCH